MPRLAISAYNAHTLQPSNEMNILLAVYLAQLGYNYDDVLWMLLPPPGNMHWLTAETAKEHHIYWAELSPAREQSPLYDYLPPAPSPPVVSTPRSRLVAQYTAADNLNLRSGPRWDIGSAHRSFARDLTLNQPSDGSRGNDVTALAMRFD